MKKLVVMVMVFLIMISFAFAQAEEIRIAVLPFAGGSGTEGEVLGRLFAKEIANAGVFTVLPHTAAIDAAMK